MPRRFIRGVIWRMSSSNLFEGLVFSFACSVRIVRRPFWVISVGSQRSRSHRWRTKYTEHASTKIRPSNRFELCILLKLPNRNCSRINSVILWCVMVVSCKLQERKSGPKRKFLAGLNPRTFTPSLGAQEEEFFTRSSLTRIFNRRTPWGGG